MLPAPRQTTIVAGLREPLDDAGQILRTVERDHLAMAVRTQALHQASRSAPSIGASPAG